MAAAERIIKIEAKVVRTTPKAVLIEYEDEELWLPRSAMIDDEELEAGQQTQIKMLPWIAKEKGII